MEIFPGVHIIAGPRHFFAELSDYGGAYVYLIQGDAGRHILIDTGFGRYTAGMVKVLESKGVAPGDIEMVALTHSHGDHIGGCRFFQRAGAKIAAHREAGETIDGTPPWDRKEPREKAQGGGGGGGDPTEAFRPDVRFADGDVLRAAGIELRVVHTPGHTPDSTSFVLERAGRKVVFTGDMWGWFIINWRSNQADMLASIRKVRALGADFCCGGHTVLDESDWPKAAEKIESNLARGIFSVVDFAKAEKHFVSSGLRLFAGLDR